MTLLALLMRTQPGQCSPMHRCRKARLSWRAVSHMNPARLHILKLQSCTLAQRQQVPPSSHPHCQDNWLIPREALNCNQASMSSVLSLMVTRQHRAAPQ